MSQDRTHPRASAFTLVELLVVVGIIVVLIAMLLPSLARARQQAQLVRCMSNQRQVLMALFMYAGDNPRVGFPWYHEQARTTDGLLVNVPQWVWVETMTTMKYVPSDAVLTCPAEERNFGFSYMNPGVVLGAQPGHLVPNAMANKAWYQYLARSRSYPRPTSSEPVLNTVVRWGIVHPMAVTRWVHIPEPNFFTSAGTAAQNLERDQTWRTVIPAYGGKKASLPILACPEVGMRGANNPPGMYWKLADTGPVFRFMPHGKSDVLNYGLSDGSVVTLKCPTGDFFDSVVQFKFMSNIRKQFGTRSW